MVSRLVAVLCVIGLNALRAQTALEAWVQRYNGPGHGHDYAQAVVVDGSGNVFVSGTSLGLGSGNDYATVAYSSEGVPLRSKGGSVAWQLYDKQGKPISEKGHADGLQSWSLPTAFAEQDSNFSIVY